jgi:hypothetical protein
MEKAAAVSAEEIAETKNIGLIEQFLAKLEYSQSFSSTIVASLSGEHGVIVTKTVICTRLLLEFCIRLLKLNACGSIFCRLGSTL